MLKHRLAEVKSAFTAAAYYHIGDTDVDEHFAGLAGFRFLRADAVSYARVGPRAVPRFARHPRPPRRHGRYAMTIRLYDPTAEPRALAADLAPRLASLAGQARRHPRQQQGQRRHADAGGGARPQGAATASGDIVKREKPASRARPRPISLDALATCDFALVGSAD